MCLGCGGSAVTESMSLLAQFITGCVPVPMQRRYFTCSSWTWLTCPLLCIAKCAVIAVMLSTPLSWRRGRYCPFLSFTYCSTLIRWSSCLVQVLLWETVEFPQLQPLSWTMSLTCPLCSTTKARGSTCRKLQWSRSCCVLLSWPDVPVVQVRVGAAFCGYGRPVIMQRPRLFSSTVEVSQTQFIARVQWTFLLCNGEGLDFQPYWLWRRCNGFWRILRHFSRSSGCPGVERQFFELSSAHTCECSRTPGVPESPGVSLLGDSRHRVYANQLS